jgi:hypothetical protein
MNLRSCALVFAIMMSTSTVASAEISDPDTAFCERFSDVKRLISGLNNHDKATVGSLFDSGACAVVKPSLQLKVLQTKGDFLRVKRVGMSQSLWTHRMFVR